MSSYWLRQNNPDGIKPSLAPKRKGLFFDESIGKPEIVLGENQGPPGKKARLTVNDAGVSCEKFQADEIKAASVAYTLLSASSMNISGDAVIGGILSSNNVVAENVSVSDSLSANGGFFQTLSSMDASFGTVSANSISSGSVIGGSISGTSGSFSSIVADSVVSASVSGTSGSFSSLVSDSVVAVSGSFSESLDVKKVVIAEGLTAVTEFAPRAQVPPPADGSVEVRSATYTPDTQALTFGDGMLASGTDFTIGFRFRTNLELHVTALCGDGSQISGNQNIGLWTDDGVLIAQVTIDSSAGNLTPDGIWFFEPITPVTLAKNTVYRMGGWFDLPGGVTSNSNCDANATFLTYIKGCRSSTTGYGFPDVIDTLGNRSGPTNFLFTYPSLIASINRAGVFSLPIQPRITAFRSSGFSQISGSNYTATWPSAPIQVGAWAPLQANISITIPTSGTYLIGYTVSFSPSAAVCTKQSWINYVQGATNSNILCAYNSYCDPISTGQPLQVVTRTDWIDAAEGDGIAVIMLQNSGVTNLLNSSSLCKFFCIKLF